MLYVSLYIYNPHNLIVHRSELVKLVVPVGLRTRYSRCPHPLSCTMLGPAHSAEHTALRDVTILRHWGGYRFDFQHTALGNVTVVMRDGGLQIFSFSTPHCAL